MLGNGMKRTLIYRNGKSNNKKSQLGFIRDWFTSLVVA